MGILGTLRSRDAALPNPTQPYIDTPDFDHAAWMAYGNARIGAVGGEPSVAVVGAGAAGLCAAYELQRAGCKVSLFEQSDQVGGRCDSYAFGKESTGWKDIVELGAMRFPPSEYMLDYYLKTMSILPGGLRDLPNFPDPGTRANGTSPFLPTLVCYGRQQVYWQQPKHPLSGFTTVQDGWIGLVTNGIYRNGSKVLAGAVEITENLNNPATADRAATQWAEYIATFGQASFFNVMYDLFSGCGSSKFDIPSLAPGSRGEAWSFDDFDRFGALGVGSGGFGPLYPISFADIFRLVINELETDQKFLQPQGKRLNTGIRSVSDEMAFQFRQYEKGKLLTGTPVTKIVRSGSLEFKLLGPKGTYGPFARVVLATTTRAAELYTNVTDASEGLLSPAVRQGIMRTHVVSSNKIGARIKNFWANDPSAVRCVLTDNMLHQAYTLDYTPVGEPQKATGVCFITYTWDDDAIKQQSLTQYDILDPNQKTEYKKQLYETLRGKMLEMGGEAAKFAARIAPLNGDYGENVMFEEWQQKPYFSGAFKLSQPGQDEYVRAMYFDYQKSQNKTLDTGVYLAGDSISFTGGWVEGAYQTALNAAAGVIRSLGGTLKTDARGRTPLSLKPDRFNYFPSTAKAASTFHQSGEVDPEPAT